MAEYSLQVVVLAVNTLLVSRAGDIALAAVGISNPIIYLFLAVFAAISVGATVLVAQATAPGIRKRVNTVARQAVVWGLLLALPLSVVAWALTPILIGLFGDDPEVQAAGMSYLHVITATSSVHAALVPLWRRLPGRGRWADPALRRNPRQYSPAWSPPGS